ncbi:phosphonate ABC transporter, permease protein PhnE [Marivivens donghaensis]|uniref:phosphonate ABC transporter, permease protein PhnE n=1 Tax=Marivivens donghaensis TaxID=1699413 RepID=UPI00201FA88D|nr:phosphonate ABC transporter, permease protein PhnE [Marivivens donghaensis]MCL7407426.1 phosphonate ABC transporter, permease protein PhnE [Marivivens donghaensis]MDN3704595.1 phosphonate ABC transporter, permease protein PhnE [Marivivens donghaensis]
MTAHTVSGTAEYLALVRRRRLYGAILVALFFVLFASGFTVAEDRNAGGFLDGLHRIFDFPKEIFAEAFTNWQNLPRLFVAAIPSLIETLNIAAIATLFGGLLGMALAFLSTRGLALWPRLTPVFRRIMDTMRAVPEIVIALVLIFLLGVGPVPAMIAIAFHTAGALGKLFSEAAENVDLKPVEGLASVGGNWFQRIWFGVMPQVAPNWSSYALLRFEINIRASAILGFVGAGGLGYDLKTALQWGQGKYDQVVAIFAILFLTIMIVDHLSDRARQRLVKGGALV